VGAAVLLRRFSSAKLHAAGNYLILYLGMASAFGHAFTAYALRSGFPDKLSAKKLWLFGIFCAVIPDADIITFHFGIAYESFWGHRGFTHSIVFSFLLALAISLLFFRKSLSSKTWFLCFAYLLLCGVSHGVLDAMTSGGRGVAFFSPFINERYFLPWRPIKVSPINAAHFFGWKGVRILANEFIWIGIPGIVFMIAAKLFKKKD
jgi:inner membrane protein